MSTANTHMTAWAPYVPRSKFHGGSSPSAQPTLASLRWQPQSRGPHLVVTHGDITKARVDAIVSATSSNLTHAGGGVAAAIQAKGGPGIARDCRVWVIRHGLLQVGQAMTTPAGSLPCTYVVHTVGPAAHHPLPETEQAQLLRTAVRSSLREADRLHLTSVAIPGISAGKNGYPTKLAAKEIVGECVEYARTMTSNTTLTTIVLMDIDKRMYRSIKKAMLETAVTSGCEGTLQKACEPIVDFQYETTLTKLKNWCLRFVPSPQSTPFELLPPDHADYKRILGELPQACVGRVVSVRRVRTPARSVEYEEVKTTLQGAFVQEKHPLYHGTPERWRASAIALNGFDLSIVKHGRSYGAGVYTTTDVSLALHYTKERGSLLQLRGLVSNSTVIRGDVHVFPNPVALVSVTIVDYAAEDEQDRKQIQGHYY